jgi:hypothetical protein
VPSAVQFHRVTLLANLVEAGCGLAGKPVPPFWLIERRLSKIDPEWHRSFMAER